MLARLFGVNERGSVYNTLEVAGSTIVPGKRVVGILLVGLQPGAEIAIS